MLRSYSKSRIIEHREIYVMIELIVQQESKH